MKCGTGWALLGAAGLLGAMALLQWAMIPVAAMQAATALLPPCCLFPALRCAARRRMQLRQATQRHQMEQQRLLLTCRALHTRIDAMVEENRRLTAQLDALAQSENLDLRRLRERIPS